MPTTKASERPGMGRLPLQQRQLDAAIGQERRTSPMCSAWRGAGSPCRMRVPEQQLQQQRDVAQRLDIERCQPASSQLLRQPPDADQCAQDRRQDDADHRDLQRVQHADRAAPGHRCRPPGYMGSATCRSGCRRRDPERRTRWRCAAPPGSRLVLLIRYHTMAPTMPTMTTCQTIERNRGSDQDSRMRRLGAARAAISRGSAVAWDIVRLSPCLLLNWLRKIRAKCNA